MNLPVVILTDFVHGRLNLTTKHVGLEFPEHTARAFERRGLVRIDETAPPKVVAGKAAAAGKARASSASPAARASTLTTSSASGAGATTSRKGGVSSSSTPRSAPRFGRTA